MNNNQIVNAKSRVGAPLKTLVVGIDSGFGRVKIAYKDSVKGAIKTDNFSSSLIIGKEALDPTKTLYIDEIPHDTITDEKITALRICIEHYIKYIKIQKRLIL